MIREEPRIRPQPPAPHLELPRHDLGPRQRTPRLALVAGLHGADLNGIFVLSRLAAFLRSLAAGERPGQRLVERVVVVPAIDVPTLARRRDLPGAPAQPVAEEAPSAVDLTRPAYYRVLLHSASLDLEELPQVRLHAPNDDERASACLFGLPAVVEHPLPGGAPGGLTDAWREAGGESFLILAGQAGILQHRHCEALYRALIAFMDRAGLVEGVHPEELEEELHYFGADQTFSLHSAHDGIFVSRLDVGRWVRAGELMGCVYDVFNGEVLSEVRTPVTGLLGALRRQPLLCAGDLLARILTPRGPRAGSPSA